MLGSALCDLLRIKGSAQHLETVPSHDLYLLPSPRLSFRDVLSTLSFLKVDALQGFLPRPDLLILRGVFLSDFIYFQYFTLYSSAYSSSFMYREA